MISPLIYKILIFYIFQVKVLQTNLNRLKILNGILKKLIWEPEAFKWNEWTLPSCESFEIATFGLRKTALKCSRLWLRVQDQIIGQACTIV